MQVSIFLELTDVIQHCVYVLRHCVRGRGLILKTPFMNRETIGCWPILTPSASSCVMDIADLSVLIVRYCLPTSNLSYRIRNFARQELKVDLFPSPYTSQPIVFMHRCMVNTMAIKRRRMEMPLFSLTKGSSGSQGQEYS